MLRLADLLPSDVLGLVESLGQQDARVALFNLGYLSRNEFDEPLAMQRGVALFRADYRRTDQGSPEFDIPTSATGPLTGAEAALLQRLTDLEGGFMFNELPQIGDSGLLSRVARLRINLFRSSPADSDVFSSADLDCLGALAEWPGCVPPALEGREAHALAALNAAGNPAELIRRVWKGLFAGSISYFHSDAGPQRPGVTRHFRSTLCASLGADNPAYVEFVQHVPPPPQGADTCFMAARMLDPRNSMALRFVQIMAWIDGYYQGSIDEAFGPASRSAIDARLADDRRAGSKDGRDACYASVADGFWVFNHVLFFTRIFEGGPNKVAGHARTEAEVFAQLERAYGRLSPRRQARARLDMLELGGRLARQPMALAADQPGQGGFWFGGFRRIAEWFGNLFRRFFDELLRPAAAQRCAIVALGLFRRLGEALSVLGRGIAYLTGPRELVVMRSDGKAIAACTRFGRDFDGVTFVSATITSAELAEHRRQCALFGRAICALFRFTAAVVRAILTAGRLSWLGMVWLILRIYLQLNDMPIRGLGEHAPFPQKTIRWP